MPRVARPEKVSVCVRKPSCRRRCAVSSCVLVLGQLMSPPLALKCRLVDAKQQLQQLAVKRGALLKRMQSEELLPQSPEVEAPTRSMLQPENSPGQAIPAIPSALHPNELSCTEAITPEQVQQPSTVHPHFDSKDSRPTKRRAISAGVQQQDTAFNTSAALNQLEVAPHATLVFGTAAVFALTNPVVVSTAAVDKPSTTSGPTSAIPSMLSGQDHTTDVPCSAAALASASWRKQEGLGPSGHASGSCRDGDGEMHSPETREQPTDQAGDSAEAVPSDPELCIALLARPVAGRDDLLFRLRVAQSLLAQRDSLSPDQVQAVVQRLAELCSSASAVQLAGLAPGAAAASASGHRGSEGGEVGHSLEQEGGAPGGHVEEGQHGNHVCVNGLPRGVVSVHSSSSLQGEEHAGAGAGKERAWLGVAEGRAALQALRRGSHDGAGAHSHGGSTSSSRTAAGRHGAGDQGLGSAVCSTAGAAGDGAWHPVPLVRGRPLASGCGAEQQPSCPIAQGLPLPLRRSNLQYTSSLEHNNGMGCQSAGMGAGDHELYADKGMGEEQEQEAAQQPSESMYDGAGPDDAHHNEAERAAADRHGSGPHRPESADSDDEAVDVAGVRVPSRAAFPGKLAAPLCPLGARMVPLKRHAGSAGGCPPPVAYMVPRASGGGMQVAYAAPPGLHADAPRVPVAPGRLPVRMVPRAEAEGCELGPGQGLAGQGLRRQHHTLPARRVVVARGPGALVLGEGPVWQDARVAAGIEMVAGGDAEEGGAEGSKGGRVVLHDGRVVRPMAPGDMRQPVQLLRPLPGARMVRPASAIRHEGQLGAVVMAPADHWRLQQQQLHGLQCRAGALVHVPPHLRPADRVMPTLNLDLGLHEQMQPRTVDVFRSVTAAGTPYSGGDRSSMGGQGVHVAGAAGQAGGMLGEEVAEVQRQLQLQGLRALGLSGARLPVTVRSALLLANLAAPQ